MNEVTELENELLVVVTEQASTMCALESIVLVLVCALVAVSYTLFVQVRAGGE